MRLSHAICDLKPTPPTESDVARLAHGGGWKAVAVVHPTVVAQEAATSQPAFARVAVVYKRAQTVMPQPGDQPARAPEHFSLVPGGVEVIGYASARAPAGAVRVRADVPPLLLESLRMALALHSMVARAALEPSEPGQVERATISPALSYTASNARLVEIRCWPRPRPPLHHPTVEPASAPHWPPLRARRKQQHSDSLPSWCLPVWMLSLGGVLETKPGPLCPKVSASGSTTNPRSL